ncbi:hypothetical protein GWK91_16265 [Virgibacillus sp. MSP4-1]|uniref:hypothetical protein n=1 Tax=Virgibacillus sp. MSP4-1 TaxID=2700081 RepID=UPI0003A687DC|nr:hypothetical protein [Virgibacillus sp. MSP4-1]QHS24337.1 hypothetical protein GWK91_16265 [Virgibacillus sp. MSP4-1]
MRYFAERNDFLNSDFSISYKGLKNYFNQIHRYFEDRKLFEVARNGVWQSEQFKDDYQLYPPSLSPSPEIFFINHLNRDKVYPIWEYYDTYKEEELFTVIEILYDHIGVYDHKKGTFISDEYKKEFAEHINNLLKRYKSGYYLNEKYGFIMELPNDAITALMNTEKPETMDDDVIEQLKTSVKMYYRFDSNEETKKKAINILADILEPLRNDLKEILNNEYDVNKNNHDKAIFNIVNGFNIRHNDKKQLTDYSKQIWYDWMMQYYTSVIFTYYRLKSEYE